MTTPTTPAAPAAPTTPDVTPGAVPESLFPHVIAPDVDNSEPTEPTTPAQSSADLTALQTEFRTFREESQAREQRLTDTIQTLMMRPMSAPAVAPVAPAGPTAFDLSDLPDPVQNPKAYNDALQNKISTYLAENSQSQNQALLAQQAQAQALNGVYSRLQTQHADLANRPILLQGAAAAAFGELRAQGIDPLLVAQQNPDGLVANIVGRMNAELGTVAVQPGAPTVPVAPIAPGVARAETVAAGSQPTAPAGPASPKPRSFAEQLKQTQQRDGLI